ncbi:hypothetical protein D0Z00_004460 [Geotrichum galactomycetum]|uniref:Uncharacterized protein n=1 Tax=Geotrichum galactomycetum TaxID=27317 RepID=A0ACB6UYD8_9ASCO|nr:hypothetical protein D0Z00_004460 [Geotrichum candidum]
MVYVRNFAFVLTLFFPGNCVYSKDWHRDRQDRRPQSISQADQLNRQGGAFTEFGRVRPTVPASSAEDDAKLVFGVVFSLRNMTRKLTDEDSFVSYKTSKYRLHYYETPSNLRFVLLTDPGLDNQLVVLKQIYVSYYLEYIVMNYTEVRDYAYPEFHPLHYGVPLEPEEFDNEDYEEEDDEVGTYPDSYMRDGGPPWKEDSDLASPVVISHSVGDRISKEYEFSVASADEIHGRAVALFDFIPENENEAPLKEGQVIWVSYRHGQGWLVAEDPRTGETGLVPEEYVQMITGHEYLSSQTEDLNGQYIEDEDDEPLQQEQLQDDDELHQQSQQQQSDIHYTEQATSSSHCKSAAVPDADGDNTRQQLTTNQFSQPPLDALPLKEEDPELAKLTTSFETTKWS